MKKQDEIEELFSSSFEGFEKIPPIEIKSSIDDMIFKENGGSTKRRRGFFWIMSSLLLVFISGIFIFSKINENNTEIARNPEYTSDYPQEKDSKMNLEKGIQNEKGISNRGERKNDLKKGSDENTWSQSSTKQYHFKTTQSAQTLLKKKVLTNSNNPNSLFDKKFNLSKSTILDGKTSKVNNGTFSNETDSKDSDLPVDLIAFNDNNFDTTDSFDSTGLTEEIDSSLATIEDTAFSPIMSPIENPIISKLSPWSISLYAGGTHGFSSLNNHTKDNYKMNESTGFSSSLETNYSLTPKYSFSTGLDFNFRNDVFTKTTPAGDSVLTNYSMQFVYQNPANQDSIIDTIYVANYSSYQTETRQEQIIQHTSIAIPIYFGWKVFATGKWNMALSTGLRFAYVNNKIVSDDMPMNVPEFKKFGLRVNMRPEISYSLKKFGIGCYLNVGYDVVPAILLNVFNDSPNATYQYIPMKRNRMDLGFGFVLKYHL